MYDVMYMTRKSGRQPVKEFIDSLDAPLKARVLRTLSLLEEFGAKLMMPYSKHIDDGIFELRVMTRGIAIRIFYFFEKDKVIVLAHGSLRNLSVFLEVNSIEQKDCERNGRCDERFTKTHQ